ncbi:uncharacterized protein [Argopecten irradians]|uniref:uncharacterized protein n=1 Tax=Argopecten irradians TaxID=31199 RepID=UPI0037165F61
MCVPDFSTKEIYNYVVLKMNRKKQLKSKVFYEDRHVHSLQICTIDENSSHCYVKCKVLPSIPSANRNISPDHDVWVMMSKVSGCVNSAECNCTAGQGEACNHIVALLYAIADISEKKREGKLAPTSQKCKWNNPRKRKLSPKKAEQLTFNKHMFEKDPSSRKCVKLFDVQRSTVNVERFRNKLLGLNSKAGWLTNFEKVLTGVHVNQPVLPSLHTIEFQYSDKVDLQNKECAEFFQVYFENLQLTEEDSVKIECMTRKQAESDIWRAARHVRITSSNFGKVIKRKQTSERDSLLKDLCGYREVSSKYLDFGRKHEAAARRTYLHQMKNDHPGLCVQQSGLIVNPKYPHLGASPDGLVYCTCEKCKVLGHGLLEIKCPASLKWRMSTPQKCAEDPNFYCYLNQNCEVTLKENHAYFYQIQGQMAITGRKWCDFVVWTCSGKASVQRVLFNEDLWSEMNYKLNQFYKESFLPELFSRRVSRGLKLHTGTKN